MDKSIDGIVIRAGEKEENGNTKVGVGILYNVVNGKVDASIQSGGLTPEMARDVMNIMIRHITDNKREDLLGPYYRSY